jgi:hypothetical protein
MSSGFQKMIAMPVEMESNEIQQNNPEGLNESELTHSLSSTKITKNKGRKINYFVDKLGRIMKIFLKLANIKAYDVIGRVRDQKGNYISDSDIISLINHAMTHGKLLLAQNEFIRLLHEAQVEPDLIINENIKAKLSNLYSNKSNFSTESEKLTEKNLDQSQSDIQITKANRKRAHKAIEQDSSAPPQEVSKEEPERKRQRNWEVLDSNISDNENESNDNIESWEFNPHKE